MLRYEITVENFVHALFGDLDSYLPHLTKLTVHPIVRQGFKFYVIVASELDFAGDHVLAELVTTGEVRFNLVEDLGGVFGLKFDDVLGYLIPVQSGIVVQRCRGYSCELILENIGIRQPSRHR